MTARPPSDRLLDQLGRHWVDNTAWVGGLTFAESAREDPANVYAGVLPAADWRLTPGASLQIGPSSVPEPYDPTNHIGVTVTIAAEMPKGATGAMGLMADFYDVIKPNGKPFVYVPGHLGATSIDGVPGYPPAPFKAGNGSPWHGNATLTLWRVVTIDVLTEPQLVATGQEGDEHDGQAMAQMSIVARVTPAEIPAPLPVFEIWHEGLGGATEATVKLCGGVLTLSHNGGGGGNVEIVLADFASITDLLVEIAGESVWPTDDDDTDLYSRPATDLVPFPETSVFNPESTEALRGLFHVYA